MEFYADVRNFRWLVMTQGSDKMSQVQDDPARHDYNVDAWVDKIIAAANDQAVFTKTIHQMWPCGSDFEYQNADHW